MKLRFVNGEYLFHHLDLDYNQFANQQINSKTTTQLDALVNNGQFLLLRDLKTLVSQFEGQCLLVYRLKQAGA